TCRTPPIPRVRPRARTQRCPRDRGEWCAGISQLQSPRLGIVPVAHIQRGKELTLRRVELALAAREQVAEAVDRTLDRFIGRKLTQIMFKSRPIAFLLPGVDPGQQMPRKCLDQTAGAEFLETLFLQGRRVGPRA